MKVELTWAKILMNCGNLLSFTKFSHAISRIQLKGFDGQVFRSRAAPPFNKLKDIVISQLNIKEVHYH